MRIVQLSDTHFLEPGQKPEGGHAYDTAAAFEAVRAHMTQSAPADLVVVTGDIADHGRTAQYTVAADALAGLPAPVNVCPGNHDQQDPLTVALGRTNISGSRVIEADNWCFLFVDSNDGVKVIDDSGRAVDPPAYADRLHCDGSLGQREASWVKAMCAATTADHVFIWLHHPPACDVPMMVNKPYTAEWESLLGQLPNVRGMGAGHTHIPAEWQVAGCPVFVAPSLKNNFDLDANTMLGPGYRTYDFAADGSIRSEIQLIEDDRWPRAPFGRALRSLFNGELTYDEFDAIVERKRAQAESKQTAPQKI